MSVSEGELTSSVLEIKLERQGMMMRNSGFVGQRMLKMEIPSRRKSGRPQKLHRSFIASLNSSLSQTKMFPIL